MRDWRHSGPRPERGRFFSRTFSLFSIRSFQAVLSAPVVHPRSPRPGEYGYVPSFPNARNGQENLGRLLHERRLLLQRKRQVRSLPLARPAKQISLHERRALPRGRPLPRPPGSAQSFENLLRSSRDSDTSESISRHWITRRAGTLPCHTSAQPMEIASSYNHPKLSAHSRGFSAVRSEAARSSGTGRHPVLPGLPAGRAQARYRNGIELVTNAIAESADRAHYHARRRRPPCQRLRSSRAAFRNGLGTLDRPTVLRL
jgi:hypothetical protein